MKKVIAGIVLVALVTVAGFFIWRNVAAHRVNSILFAAPQGQILGPADAPVTIVELMDYSCEGCRKVYPAVKEALARNPDTRFIIRHVPLKPGSVLEAEMAMAAGLQGRFDAMHDLLMTREGSIKDGDEARAIARVAGVDPDKMEDDLGSQAFLDTLLATMDALKLLRVNGVPAFVTGRAVYVSRTHVPTADELDAMIARVREQKGLKKPADAE